MKYYTIIPRYFFTSLYRYGNLTIDSSNLIPTDLTKNEIIERGFNDLKQMPYFEYDEECIIITVEIDDISSKYVNLHINQVHEYIALSRQAKSSISSKIDKRIEIKTYEWASQVLAKIEDYYQEEELFKGIEALWKISGFDDNWDTNLFLPMDIKGDLILGLKERSLVKSSEKQQKNLIVQTLVYDRIDFFPKGFDGYLFDIFEILCNHLEKGFRFEKTDLYPFLINVYSEDKSNCWNLYKQEEANEKLINIRNRFNEKKPSESLRWENCFAWFLAQKKNIQDSNQFDPVYFRKELEKSFNGFENERKMAVVLLGAFFGYKYFYDALYDLENLKFFKTNNEPLVHSEKPKVKMENDTILQGSDIPHSFPISSKHKKMTLVDGGKLISNNEEPKKLVKTASSAKKSVGKKSENEIIVPELPFNIPELIEPPLDSPPDPNDVPFEVVRSKDIKSYSSSLLSEDSKSQIRGIVLSFSGLNNRGDVSKWIVNCCEKWKSLNYSTVKDLVKLFLSKEKPSGFGETNAKKIADKIFNKNIL